MAASSLRRFSNPEMLQTINPSCLAGLLYPYRAYFAARGIVVPLPESENPCFDYKALVLAFLSPDRDMPQELIEALYVVNEMASPSGMDALIAAAREQGVKLEDARLATPLDIAARAYVRDREFVESIHQRYALMKNGTYTYFRGSGPVSALDSVPQERLEALRQDLDNYYFAHNRGRHCRIHMFQRDGRTWFNVRHGDAFKRAVDIESEPNEILTFRPECFSAMLLVAETAELGICASSKRELDLYRRLMGRHLFGFDEFFCGVGRFTLAPLVVKGPDCLRCADVSGIDWVKLVEVIYERALPNYPRETRSAPDLYDSYPRGIVPEDARLLGARFKLKFHGAGSARRLSLYPPNEARHSRESDVLLTEQWLHAREFLHNAAMPGGGKRCEN